MKIRHLSFATQKTGAKKCVQLENYPPIPKETKQETLCGLFDLNHLTSSRLWPVSFHHSGRVSKRNTRVSVKIASCLSHYTSDSSRARHRSMLQEIFALARVFFFLLLLNYLWTERKTEEKRKKKRLLKFTIPYKKKYSICTSLRRLVGYLIPHIQHTLVYKPNQWIVFFSCALIGYSNSWWYLPFTFQNFTGFRARVFPHFIEKKKELFGAGYQLAWHILKQLFTSVLVKSGRYLPRRFAARQTSSTIHFHFGE